MAFPTSNRGRQRRAARSDASPLHAGLGWLGSTAAVRWDRGACRRNESPEGIVDGLGGGEDLRQVRVEEHDAGAGPRALKILAADAALKFREVVLGTKVVGGTLTSLLCSHVLLVSWPDGH